MIAFDLGLSLGLDLDTRRAKGDKKADFRPKMSPFDRLVHTFGAHLYNQSLVTLA
ncbi:MAG: hypothetical protein Q4C87_09365 [Actinomycetaceae bacterium]|nr:hypothetical protein [Actinomycetaceae bacterium]